MEEKIGIVAGNGVLPRVVAAAIRAAGDLPLVVAIEGETDPSISEIADLLGWVRLGQLGRIRTLLSKAGVNVACFAGGVEKVRFFRDARPDVLGVKVLAKVAASRGDDRLLRTIGAAFEESNIKLLPATSLAPSLVATTPGVLGKRKPKQRDRDDISLGRGILKTLGAHDIGQVVVLREGVVLAVEASEGTDACIARAQALANGPVVVVKAAKPGQDLRFDQPAIGPSTVNRLVEGGGGVLAIETETTLMLEREELIRLADKGGIPIFAFERTF